MSAGDRFEPLRQYVWDELDRRNWSMVRLSREAGISHSTISNVLNHVSPTRMPGIPISKPFVPGFALYTEREG